MEYWLNSPKERILMSLQNFIQLSISIVAFWLLDKIEFLLSTKEHWIYN